MNWTFQNLKDSGKKQQILHFGSIFGAATVLVTTASSAVTLPCSVTEIGIGNLPRAWKGSPCYALMQMKTATMTIWRSFNHVL
jgi:hypothetical protein